MSRRSKPPSLRRAEPGPNDALRTVTQMIVAAGRQQRHDYPQIRSSVSDAIREALDGEEPWAKLVAFPGRDAPEEAVSTAGPYRLAFGRHGLDRRDLHAQERWHRLVMDELEATLGRDDGDS